MQRPNTLVHSHTWSAVPVVDLTDEYKEVSAPLHFSENEFGHALMCLQPLSPGFSGHQCHN